MGSIPRVPSFGSRPLQHTASAPPKYNACPLLKKRSFAVKSSIVNSPEGAVLVFGEALFGDHLSQASLLLLFTHVWLMWRAFDDAFLALLAVLTAIEP